MLSIDDNKTDNFCLAYACNEERENGTEWEVKVCLLDNSTGIYLIYIILILVRCLCLSTSEMFRIREATVLWS